MATTLLSVLGRAASTLGQCVKATEANGAPSGLTLPKYERLIDLGVACDWLGWARQLLSLSYSNKKRSESDRAYCLNEPTRFTFMWTATNALFPRSPIIELLDPRLLLVCEGKDLRRAKDLRNVPLLRNKPVRAQFSDLKRLAPLFISMPPEVFFRLSRNQYSSPVDLRVPV